MRRFWIFTLMVGYLLGLLALGSTAGAAEKNFQSFVLSNEGPGFISKLVAAGIGSYNLYDTVILIVASSDPSISGVVTNQFLNLLQSNPVGSQIFSIKLDDLNLPGTAVAINEDGTVEAISIYGFIYSAQPGNVTGTESMGYNLPPYKLTSSPQGEFLASWTHVVPPDTIHYHAFAVAWAGYRLNLPIIFKAGGN